MVLKDKHRQKKDGSLQLNGGDHPINLVLSLYHRWGLIMYMLTLVNMLTVAISHVAFDCLLHYLCVHMHAQKKESELFLYSHIHSNQSGFYI